MRIVFMGTPAFAVPSLERLVADGHTVCGVFTQPDKPKNRGMKLAQSPVKECALTHNIPVFQPKTLKDGAALEQLEQLQPELIAVAAYGKILPQAILDMTPYGCVNVHASLLPKYRGAAPIQWAVINGEKVSGVTTMQMDAGLDTGDMLLKTEVVLDEKETGGSLHDKLAEAGARLCVETLKGLEAHAITPEKQGESPTEYARMLDKSLGKIDWTRPAEEIERLIRGLNPWPSAYTDWTGKTMKIWEAQVISQEEAKAAQQEAAKPGTVVKVEKDGFLVQTGKDLLKVCALQIPGKKRMDAGSFLRGNSVSAGTVLGV